MSKSTYISSTIAALVLGALTACGSASHPASRPPASSPPATSTPITAQWSCLSGTAARGVTVGANLDAVLLGASADVVVFSDESDERLCSWLPLARTLVAAGYEAVLYDYVNAPQADLAAVVGYARAHGAQRVELVGASEGAKTSIVAAAGLHPGADAVVSLSAEDQLQGTAVAPYAARLTTPTLFVTAADDPYGSTAATRGYYASAPARDKRLVVVPGQDHGIALLATRSVHDAVVAFVERHAPTGPQPAACAGLPGAHPFWLPGPGGMLEANAAGSGPDAVIFLHEIGTRGMCGFAPYAAWLAAHQHVQVVLVNRCNYGASTCTVDPGRQPVVAETKPAVDWARAHGASRVTVVGASGGGMDALEVAAQLPGLAAVVDVSGDVNDTGANDAALARRVTIPALLAVAPDDPDCSVASIRATYGELASRTKRFVVADRYPGRHGWDLLIGDDGAPLPLAGTVAQWVGGHYG